MSEPIRILLADDHVLFRRGVASVLEPYSNLEVVGEAGDGLEAVAMARDSMPDMILMDINMPNLSGLEAIKQIKREMPHIMIIVLTVSDDHTDIFEAIKNGARGYLIKDLKEAQLISTIEGVARGEAFFSGKVAARILQEFQQPDASNPDEPVYTEHLTEREKEVLQLIVQGLSNKEIASALSISSGTIKNHVTNILSKLHLQNRLQAAVYAMQHGLGEKPAGGWLKSQPLCS